MSRTYDVAIAGATGAVGEALLQILEEREFPVGRLFPLASERSVDRTVRFRGEDLRVEGLDDFDFGQVRLGLFSAGASVSEKIAPRAVEAGAVVIDNTSRFRYDPEVPLVVPECNAERIADYTRRGIIANPNCSTIQMVVACKPIQDAVGIDRINVSTYQSVSGAGRQSMEMLTEQSRTILANGEIRTGTGAEKVVAFNAVPKIGQLMNEHEVVELEGTRILLTHGDLLCTDDKPYMALRATVRDPQWQRDFLAKPIEERRTIADNLRDRSQEAIAEKPPEIMDVNQQTVEAKMREYGVHVLLHGHTHRPGIHHFELDGAEATRIVLGAWYEQGSLVRWDLDGYRLETLPR